MNLTTSEIEDFGSRLTSLGGRLGFDKASSDRFIDIEEFFLDATRFVFADVRLARCIDNWVRIYGFLISPSKLKRLIEKENYPYDSAVLGVFLILISRNKGKQLNLGPLKKFCKKRKELTYRSKLKFAIKDEYHDPDWLKFNIATHLFVDEAKKNLLNLEWTLNQSPELRYRIETDDILCSDYKAFIKREGRGDSLNFICKRIHGHYSNLHKIHTRFEKFGVYKRLEQELLILPLLD